MNHLQITDLKALAHIDENAGGLWDYRAFVELMNDTQQVHVTSSVDDDSWPGILLTCSPALPKDSALIIFHTCQFVDCEAEELSCATLVFTLLYCTMTIFSLHTDVYPIRLSSQVNVIIVPPFTVPPFPCEFAL